MTTINSILAHAKGLKHERPLLTEFEALQFACSVEQINVFKKAFNVSPDPQEDNVRTIFEQAVNVMKVNGR